MINGTPGSLLEPMRAGKCQRGYLFPEVSPRLMPCVPNSMANAIAWKLRATEGYRLSKPLNAKITNLFYVEDLKVYAALEGKLERELRDVNAMEDIGLH